MTRFYLLICSATLMAFNVTSVTAHVMPWREGDSRLKGYGHCAKGPCMNRYDFSASKPHHHHGKRVVAGDNQHTAHCAIRD